MTSNDLALANQALRRIREEDAAGKPTVTLFQCEAAGLVKLLESRAVEICDLREQCAVLEDAVQSWKNIAGHMERKALHGCTDAWCAECDGEQHPCE